MPHHYNWLNHESLTAFCLTIAVGAALPDVEQAFQIVPSTRQDTRISEYWDTFGKDSAGGNDVVQLNSLHHSVIAVENNGWTGADDHDAKLFAHITASAYVSIYSSVNGNMRFVYARNGTLVRAFDPLLYNADGALAEEQRFAWGTPAPLQSAFGLAEVLTGVVITEAWLLGQAHPTHRTRRGNPPAPASA
jgi:hypothetical protein